MNIRIFAAAAASLLALSAATTAAAHTYDITVTGVVDSATGTPQGFAVGDTVTLHATFNDSNVLPNGDGSLTGYYGVQPTHPVTLSNGVVVNVPDGPGIYAPYSITLNGYQIVPFPGDAQLGSPLVTTPTNRYLSAPTITFDGSHALDVDTNSILITFISGPPSGNLFFSSSGSTFGGNESLTAQGTPFAGHWNLASSVVIVDGQPVPEPATWTMLIMGFGLIGAGLRRRRAALAET